LTNVSDRHLPEPDPRDHAADKPMPLRHCVEDLERTTTDQAKIAGVEWNGRVAEVGNQAVEHACRQPFATALTFAAFALPVYDVRAPVNQFHHARQQLGRILKIGVDNQYPLAPADLESRSEREL